MTFMEVNSPAVLLLFVGALLWIIMDIHFQELTLVQKWLAPLTILFLAVFNETLRALFGIDTMRKMFLLTMQLPYFLLFLYLTKCGPLKMLFTIFSAMIFSSLPTMILCFISPLVPAGSWLLHLCRAVSYLAMLLLIQLIFRRSFNYLLKYGDNQVFLPFFLVGILYYAYVFSIWRIDLSGFNTASGILVRYLPTLQVFTFYFSLMRNYQELSEKRDLENAQTALNQELDTAEEQIALLNEAQRQSAVYRHDMRHHLTVINGYLTSGSLPQAQAYIQKVCEDIEAVTPQHFCENQLLDLLCSSFVSQAKQKGIRLQAEAALPKKAALSDTEICAMVSNGLENALNAVELLDEDRRWVWFYCGIQLNKILIEIKNPYMGQIPLRDGLPVSKQKGHGYGCHSIRTITEHHHGMCIFHPDNGLFTLRIMIPI